MKKCMNLLDATQLPISLSASIGTPIIEQHFSSHKVKEVEKEIAKVKEVGKVEKEVEKVAKKVEKVAKEVEKVAKEVEKFEEKVEEKVEEKFKEKVEEKVDAEAEKEEKVEDILKRPMNILLVLPAIGDNNFMEKLSFLKHNIRIILNTAPVNAVFQMFITCYRLSLVKLPITITTGNPPRETQAIQELNPGLLIRRTIIEALADLPNRKSLPLHNIKIKQARGFLGQFLFNFVKPANYDKVDYVYLFLDDIRFTENFKLDLLQEVYSLSNLDIISPALTHDSPHSYDYMLQTVATRRKYKEATKEVQIDLIRQTSILEFYSYFMSFEVYKRYHEAFLGEKTKWMWGIDLALSNAGFKVGIYDYLTMHHYYQTADHKERYGKNTPSPLDEKRRLNERFEFSDYYLKALIKI